MSNKRKDDKGRLLRAGESQRKDLTYQYRYVDRRGRRVAIYASNLNELREKEQQIQRNLMDGIDYSDGKITVSELVQQYIDERYNVRASTLETYKLLLNGIKRTDFGSRKVCDIGLRDAKIYFIEMYREGKKFSTISNYKRLLSASFRMACDEDYLRKNPFNFELGKVLRNGAEPKTALTREQQSHLLHFIRTDRILHKYYNLVFLLLSTGIRVSELCGLCEKDVDFENGRIHINHQILTRYKSGRYVEEPKSRAGNRYIPLTEESLRCIKRAISQRKKGYENVSVGEHKGFLFINQRGNPYSAQTVDSILNRIERGYCAKYPAFQIPHITPHILRHTFCTDIVNAGVDIKSVQYLM